MNCGQDKSLPLVKNEMGLASEVTGFRLYIRGMYPDSVRALAATRAICERYLPGRCSLEIIDTLNDPERMSADGITKMPTLVKLSPLPIIRLAGDLEEPEQILCAFGLIDVMA